MRFNIDPHVGARPVIFGMSKIEVRSLLGPTEGSSTIWDKSGTADYWLQATVNVGYSNDEIADHIGFSPGDFELTFRGSAIWSPHDHPDPNPVLLAFDPEPLERVGFLVFHRLGVTTTGYHDDDEAQRALTVYVPGTWNKLLLKATVPDLSRYQ